LLRDPLSPSVKTKKNKKGAIGLSKGEVEASTLTIKKKLASRKKQVKGGGGYHTFDTCLNGENSTGAEVSEKDTSANKVKSRSLKEEPLTGNR